MTKYENVESYLADQSGEKATTLRQLISFILSLDERLSAAISWNVPQIKLGSKYVFGMSAAKNHLTLAPWGDHILDNLRPQLADYVVNKGTFQVPMDWKVDEALIRTMVAQRLSDLET